MSDINKLVFDILNEENITSSGTPFGPMCGSKFPPLIDIKPKTKRTKIINEFHDLARPLAQAAIWGTLSATGSSLAEKKKKETEEEKKERLKRSLISGGSGALAGGLGYAVDKILSYKGLK